MPALQLRVFIQASELGAFVRELHEQVLADVGVGHLSATETDRDFQTVAVFEESLSVSQLNAEIILPDARRHPDLLDLDDVLISARLFLPFCLLKTVFAVIHDLTDRRI